MVFPEYYEKIKEILYRLEELFPPEFDYGGRMHSPFTSFLSKQGKMEILFDFRKEHQDSEEFRIRFIPTNHRADMVNIHIVQWWNHGQVIFYQRPGVILEDMTYRFAASFLTKIINAHRDGRIYNLRVLSEIGGEHDLSLNELAAYAQS